jgi:opacity protein-like surface antigen
MARKFALFMLVFTSLCAVAQETPKFELFAGYSLLNETKILSNDRPNLNGWNLSLAGNLNHWFGIEGDFSGHYGRPDATLVAPICGFFPGASCIPAVVITKTRLSLKQHNFLFGPKLSFRRSRVTPFVHALFGGAHISLDVENLASLPVVGESFSDDSFAMAFGGGLDLSLTPRVALRVQPDYLQTSFLGQTQHDLRISTGMTFRF